MVENLTVRCVSRMVLCIASAILIMLIMGEDASAAIYKDDLPTNPKKFYVALDYAPALGRVSTFDIVGDGKTSIALPYLKNDQEDWFNAEAIDWDAPNPSLQFNNSVLQSWIGSIGYKMMGGRLELEVGHEKFGARVSSRENREENSDVAYVFFSRLLPYYLVSAQYEKLISGLANLTEDEILAFANGVADQRPDLDKKICKGARLGGDLRGTGAQAACRDSDFGKDVGGFGAYMRKAIGTYLMWKYDGSNDSYGLKRGSRRVNSEDIVSYIKELTKEERKILAGILAVATGYGEVVEIPSVAATSVMVNACYDYHVPLTRKRAFAYSCVGLGSTFVEIVDERSTAKLAYRLKAGLSYNFASGVTAFVGGFYHHIIGDSWYDRVPMRTVFLDEKTGERPVKTGKVDLSLDYIGAECGIRLIL
ncbi:P44/Msp2 family outer membrane protein [Anaplasma phagocytophilum str. Norway variant1]|uniref:P44/Msp2 family outer membrane protein n=1 Tax=Anaplasma phagocytophilum str. Norway variant1 TaxID=1392506 RepID=A0A7H9E1D9_ANAPH|nr:P44/Msp2 family outer membrane protein [Anaplasma phagocytophilum]QLL67156.1 P44/Msp2 family outer membrane protein [Anaplasma phagocytophilum str. Norway variant1]